MRALDHLIWRHLHSHRHAHWCHDWVGLHPIPILTFSSKRKSEFEKLKRNVLIHCTCKIRKSLVRRDAGSQSARSPLQVLCKFAPLPSMDPKTPAFFSRNSGKWEREWECVSERECVCVCESESEWECVCVRERVCVYEKERERERVSEWEER